MTDDPKVATWISEATARIAKDTIPFDYGSGVEPRKALEQRINALVLTVLRHYELAHDAAAASTLAVALEASEQRAETAEGAQAAAEESLAASEANIHGEEAVRRGYQLAEDERKLHRLSKNASIRVIDELMRKLDLAAAEVDRGLQEISRLRAELAERGKV